jgi:hypothetical protein
VWRGPVRWLLMGHQFMARKREEVVGDGIHSGDRIVGGYHDGCELW